SSVLSLLGSAGQGNYTASSAFLDSLAAHRRASSLPATAINWSAWSGGGLATASGARGEAMWSSLGVKFISPDLASQAFEELMHRDVDQIAVAAVDWPTYAGKVGGSPFLSELSNRAKGFGSSKLVPEKDAPDIVLGAKNDQARQLLLSRLQQHIMTNLGFTEIIDPDQRLNDLGVDSLTSVALSNSLEKEFGIPVSVAELIKGPTINQLVDGAFRELIGSFSAQSDQASGTVATAAPIVTPRGPAIQAPTKNEQASSKVWTAEVNVGCAEVPRRPPSLSTSSNMPPVPPQDSVRVADAEPAALNSGERAKLQTLLQRRIMAELGFADPIDADQPLNEIGLDSLRAVALSNGLEKDLGIPVSVAVLIKGPTINQLVDYLLDEFAGTLPVEHAETHSPMMTASAAARASAANLTVAVADVHSPAAPGAREGNGTPDAKTAANASASDANGGGTEDLGTPISRPVARAAVQTIGKWLIAPRPNPDAKARLFCFPYAGGGLVSFRTWPQLLDPSVEMVAVEPPGRGTRINEIAVDDLDALVECLLPEMTDWLDRPSAFFGHCLG